MDTNVDITIDDIAQSIYGCCADELNSHEYESCQKELETYLRERQTEGQLALQ